jgi:hypothetical protein
MQQKLIKTRHKNGEKWRKTAFMQDAESKK